MVVAYLLRMGYIWSLNLSLPSKPIWGRSFKGNSFWIANSIISIIASIFRDWITVLSPIFIPASFTALMLDLILLRKPFPVLLMNADSFMYGNWILNFNLVLASFSIILVVINERFVAQLISPVNLLLAYKIISTISGLSNGSPPLKLISLMCRLAIISTKLRKSSNVICSWTMDLSCPSLWQKGQW